MRVLSTDKVEMKSRDRFGGSRLYSPMPLSSPKLEGQAQTPERLPKDMGRMSMVSILEEGQSIDDRSS